MESANVSLENELKETFDAIYFLIEKGHEVKLEPEALVAIVNKLLNIPKASFIKLNLQNDKGINFLTDQLIRQVKDRAFRVVEEIFYYIPRLKSSITPDLTDNQLVL
jgi:hypothetical protein